LVSDEQLEMIATSQSTRGECRACVYFEDDAAAIERGLPGLIPLSSAHGASRADDGLCSLHDRYLRASASCGSFAPKRPARNRQE
jgi:hypothetical protein